MVVKKSISLILMEFEAPASGVDLPLLHGLNYRVEKIFRQKKTFHPCLTTRKRESFEKHPKKINNDKTYIDASSHKTRLFHSSCSAKLLHIFTGSALATVLSFAIFTLPTSSASASDSWANLCTKHWSSWTRFPRYWLLLQQKNKYFVQFLYSKCNVLQFISEQILGNKEIPAGIKAYNLLVIAIENPLLIRVQLKYPNDLGGQFVNFLGAKVERHHQSTSAHKI